MPKLVILDRDGVINEDSDAYIRSVADWRPLPGSLQAIARLQAAGHRVFVASNQSGVGRGLMSMDDLLDIHRHMQQQVIAAGGFIDGIAFAPEHPDVATSRRKPGPGMLLEIAAQLQLPTLARTPFVGDSVSDVLAARAAGAIPVLLRSGKGEQSIGDPRCAGVETHDNLAAFVDHWLRQR